MKRTSKRKRSSTGKRRQTRHEQPVAPLGDTISEYTRKVKTSRATAYRQMADGSLRYVMVRGQRRIPQTEYVRHGWVSPAE
jgi:hypothetical protein